MGVDKRLKPIVDKQLSILWLLYLHVNKLQLFFNNNSYRCAEPSFSHMVGCYFLADPILSNSSGVFISASEDKTGILDVIEEKIARVTMLPRMHGEVIFIE